MNNHDLQELLVFTIWLMKNLSNSEQYEVDLVGFYSEKYKVPEERVQEMLDKLTELEIIDKEEITLN